MKYIFILMFAVVCSSSVKSQSHELKQLLLNLEKLSQFKKILQQMYDGYKILDKGYTEIKNISEGNFSLHKTFLDELLKVSPLVAKYKKIPETIRLQAALFKDYKEAFAVFKLSGLFNKEELSYMGDVYERLFDQSVKQMNELLMVLTGGVLRMNDDERLQQIDRIHAQLQDQFSFLISFNRSSYILLKQRQKAGGDLQLERKLYGLP